MKNHIANSALIICLLLASLHSHAGKIPLQDFARWPDYEIVDISPNGEYLAATFKEDTHTVLSVINLKNFKTIGTLSFSANENVANFHWVNEERLVASIIVKIGYLDFGINFGDLFAMNADGKKRKMIFGPRVDYARFSGSHIKKIEPDRAHHQIINILPDDPKHILIAIRRWQNYGAGTPRTLYRLNVYSGKKSRVLRSPIRYDQLLTDRKGKTWLASGFSDDGLYQVFYKQGPNKDWRIISTSKGVGETNLQPIGFSADPNKVYIRSNAATNTDALYLMNLHTGKKTLLFNHPIVDFAGYFFDQYREKLLGIWVHAGKPEPFYTEPEHALVKLRKTLAQTFPGHTVSITSYSKDASKAIAFVQSDRNPGDYYLIDSKTLNRKYLMSQRRWIDPAAMAPMQTIELQARDGTVLYGYLTRPKGKLQKHLPLVVMPHGGPEFRDYWGFNAEIQMLANRGFAVLQVNFRGSNGYGRAFLQAGNLKWGSLIQDDITDAVRWSIEQGYTDPKRICISGVSFGAYAAMMGVIREPDLYQCAIGMSGVYDLDLMFKKGDIQRQRVLKNALKERIGSKQENLKKQSPLHLADKINVPVLLVHGAKDERAPIAHAKALRKSLLAQGKAVQWLEKSGEGHGFSDEDNRTEYFATLIDFLQKHIGAE